MRQFRSFWMMVVVAGLIGLAGRGGPLQADVIVEYDFGNGSLDDGALNPTVQHVHTTSSAFASRHDKLISSPGVAWQHFSGGMVGTLGWTDDRATTDAFYFELTIEDGWVLDLEDWYLAIYTNKKKIIFQMSVEQLASNQTVISTTDWGWYNVHVTSATNTDILAGSDPEPLSLVGGYTYRFNLIGLGETPDSHAKATVYVDNVRLNGTLSEGALVPEPGSSLLLIAGLALAGVRGCHGRWSAQPCA